MGHRWAPDHKTIHELRAEVEAACGVGGAAGGGGVEKMAQPNDYIVFAPRGYRWRLHHDLPIGHAFSVMWDANPRSEQSALADAIRRVKAGIERCDIDCPCRSSERGLGGM